MALEVLHAQLETWLANAAGAGTVTLIDMEKMSGGAIQENWAVSAAFSSGPMLGMQELVVRTDAPASVSTSHSRQDEYILLKMAFEAGVKVPEPLWQCVDIDILGRPFFVMRRLDGEARGHKLVKYLFSDEDRRLLLQNLGCELAKIHTLTPPSDRLSFLPVPETTPAHRDIAQYRHYLDEFLAPHPVLEWGLIWLERNAPDCREIVLSHRDFRTGNYMVNEHGLSGILDWEFAAWGDPMADIGWFCAKCWRFGANEHEAGGIGERQDFYAGYEKQSGRTINSEAVRYWEIMAHVRWAVIAVQQGDRFVRDGEQNLEAALTAYVVPELELEILRMTKESEL